MLLAHLESSETFARLLAHPIWEKALAWIRQMPTSQAPGVYPIIGEQMYANVDRYATKPREACRYESHRTYIDLQYCISGGELIEWHCRDTLQSEGEYEPDKDVRFHVSPSQAGGVLQMTPGTFAIFFPPDAHMPQLADGVHPDVWKVVIKVARQLLGS